MPAIKKTVEAPAPKYKEAKASRVLRLTSLEDEVRTLPYESQQNTAMLERKGFVGDTDISVQGTAKQWQYFDGATVLAEYVEAPQSPTGYKWVYGPITPAPMHSDADMWD